MGYIEDLAEQDDNKENNQPTKKKHKEQKQ